MFLSGQDGKESRRPTLVPLKIIFVIQNVVILKNEDSRGEGMEGTEKCY
jgi:hypothetical protein